MSAQEYLAIVDEEVERHRKADGSVDAEAVSEAVFVAAFVEVDPAWTPSPCAC